MESDLGESQGCEIIPLGEGHGNAYRTVASISSAIEAGLQNPDAHR